MARPRKFSKVQLQEAALGLVDEHGLPGLSMRSLAAALGTGAMTLYTHVADRAELDTLVVDAVLAEARWPAPVAGDWREEVRATATAMWRAVRAHPHAIPLILTRRSRSPALADWSEALLRGLARAGLADRPLLVAFRTVTAFVAGFAQAELAAPLAREAGEAPDVVIERFRALPADRYPHLVGVAGVAAGSAAEDEFASGLELLLAGLAAGRRPTSDPRLVQ